MGRKLQDGIFRIQRGPKRAGLFVVLGVFVLGVVYALVLGAFITDHTRVMEEERVGHLSRMVSVARLVLEPVSAKVRAGELTREQARAEAAEFLRPLRFEDGNVAMFLLANDGTVLLQPLAPEQEGANLWFARGGEGSSLTRQLILGAYESPEGGFVRPEATGRVYFVVPVPGLNACVGTGVDLAAMRQGDKRFSLQAGLLGAFMFVLAVLPLSVMLLMLRGRNRELEQEVATRKRIEEVMLDSEQRYRSLYDNAPVGICQTTLDGRMLRANPILASHIGYDSVRELLESGLNVEEVLYVHKEDRRRMLDMLLTQGDVQNQEIMFRPLQGKAFWTTLTARLVRDQDGEPQYIESFIVDIDDRKRAEENLRVSEERYRLVSLQPDQLVWELDVVTVRMALTGDVAAVTGHDPDAEGIDQVGFWTEKVHPEDKGALQLGRGDDDESGDVFHQEFRFQRGNGQYVFLENRGVVLRDHLGRAYRMLGILRDISQRKQAELERERSEATLRAMLNAIQEAALLFDAEGRVLTVNAEAARRVGMPPEDTLGLRMQDWMDEEIAESRYEHLLDVVRTKVPVRFVDEREGVIYENTYYPVLTEQGEVERVAVFARDITEQRKADHAVRESEARLRSIFENAPVGIMQLTPEGVPLTVNAELAAIVGFESPEAYLAEVSNIRDAYVDPDHHDEVMRRMVVHGQLSGVEVQVYRRDGSAIWVYFNAVAVADQEGGATRYEAFVHDITEQKAARQALHESEFRYRALFESAADALIMLQNGAVADCNQAALDLYGVEREEILGLEAPPFSPELQPDGRNSQETGREYVRRALDGEPQRFRWNHQRRNGDILYTHVSLSRIGGEGDNRILAVVHDLTERWLAEEQRLRFEHIASASNDHMAFIDMNDVFQAANQAYAQGLGTTMEELIGRHVPDVFGPAAWEQVKEFRDRVRKGEVATYSQWLDLPGAGKRYYEAVYSPYFDANGVQAGIVVNRRDVTERQRMQDALRESERRYRLLAENAVDVIWTTDLDLRLIYISPSVKGFSGWGAEEIMRDRPEVFFGDDSWGEMEATLKDLKMESLRLERTQGKGRAPTGPAPARRLELSMKHKDGRSLWADVLLTVVRAEDGQLEGFQGVTRDVTERKLAREALARSLRFEQVVDLCAKKLLASTGRKKSLNGVLEEVLRTADVSRTYIFVNFEDPEDGLCCRQTHEVCAPGVGAQINNENLKHISYRSGINYFMSSLSRGKPVVGHIREFPEPERTILAEQDILSLLALPLRVAGEWYGFIGFDEVREEREWEQSELLFLETVADMVGAYFERMESEENLRQAYAELDQVFNSTGNGMALYDMEGRVRRVNRPMLDMFGLSAEGVLFKQCHEILPVDCRSEKACPARMNQNFLDPEGFEFDFLDKDGKTRWIAVSASPFKDAEGVITGAVVIYRDITRRVTAQEEALRRQEQLVQADKLASLGTLVSGVAHEINNPNGVISLTAPTLSAIWQGVKPLLEERFAEQGDFKVGDFSYSRVRDEVDYLFEQVVESGRRIKRIVAELKDFARQDAAALNQEVDLAEVLQAAVGLVGNKIKKATTRFKFFLPRGPVMVKGNFQRLEQVLVNVLINACEALTATDQPVEAALSRDEKAGMAVLRVSDKGKGMAEEDIKQIFDPFFTTKLDQGGTGLGLSVSHGIILEHGGSMEYQSVVGEGTTCVIRLALLGGPQQAEEAP